MFFNNINLFQCVVWYGSISLVSIPARLAIAKIDLSRNTQERRMITAPLHNTVVLHCKDPLSEPPARLNWWKETKVFGLIYLDISNTFIVNYYIKYYTKELFKYYFYIFKIFYLRILKIKRSWSITFRNDYEVVFDWTGWIL